MTAESWSLVVEDVEVDDAGAVPCLRVVWGLVAGGVLLLGRALGTVATVLTVEGSGVVAAERAAEAAVGPRRSVVAKDARLA